MDILNELQRNANLLTAFFTLGLFIVALCSMNTWKKEIYSRKRKELADNLLEIINFLEYQYGLKTNDSEKKLEHDKTLKKYGEKLNMQKPQTKLRLIKIELDKIKTDYISLKENHIVELLNNNINFIDNLLNQENLLFPINKEQKNQCKLNQIKDFCMKENQKFYS